MKDPDNCKFCNTPIYVVIITVSYKWFGLNKTETKRCTKCWMPTI